MRSGASGFISLFVTPVSVGDIVMENVDPTCCKRTGEGTQEDGRVRDVKAFKVKRTGEEGARSNFLGVSRGQQRADARRAVAIANEGSSKDCSSMAVSQGENIGKVAEEVFTAMMFLGPVKQQPPECAANGGGDGAARRESLCSWMMSLTEKNMKKLYEENWGWDEKKKLRELRSPQARFIVAWMLPPECGGNAQIDPAGFEASEGGQLFGTHPVGFVHYRFIEDDARAVLYIYEIQVADGARGMGLGHQLMLAVENSARDSGMRKVVLTCFKGNTIALSFYKKVGYSVDETCPSMSASSTDASFTILSKDVSVPPMTDSS